jgi:hypothetical protein
MWKNNFTMVQWVVVKRRSFSFGKVCSGGYSCVLVYFGPYPKIHYGEDQEVMFQFSVAG